MKLVILILQAMLILSLSISGCATPWFTDLSGYDSREVTMQTISLFDQRTSPNLGRSNWKGDWLFRRDRLELVDDELRSLKPDMIIFQEMMAKRGSPSESDHSILAGGALQGYGWDLVKVGSFDDTFEDQYHAIAVGLPLVIPPSKKEESIKRSWKLGGSGHLTFSLISLENRSVMVFNVDMGDEEKSADVWYRFVKDRIQYVLNKNKECANRVIIAGFMPEYRSSEQFLKLKEELELKDVAEDDCQDLENCLTGSNQNQIFTATAYGMNQGRFDKILVHNSAIISSSAMVFSEPKKSIRYLKTYGISDLPPSQRYGWGATVRLAKCPK